MTKRRLEESFFKVLMILASLIVFGGAAAVFIVIFIKGFHSLNWEMLTQSPKGGYYMGGGGGILNAIVGTVLVAGGATLLAAAAALPVVLYIHAYARRRAWVEVIRFALDLLWGIPSIVYGVFGFAIMVYFGMKASLGAGIITVALLEFPIAARGMDEIVRLVPAALRETSFGLGATRLETAAKVVLRQALPGLVSAVLIAFGRGVGDAASVLFTAGFSDRIPKSLGDPAATLPLAIFFQLGSPFPEVQQRAYAAALVLTAIILIVSIVTKWLTRRAAKNRIAG
jgi:phosphate transport system permease protein